MGRCLVVLLSLLGVAPVLAEERPRLFASGVLRVSVADGETVEIDVFSFMTTKPNQLVATIHPSRMPVMLTSDGEWDLWLNGTATEARSLVHSYPAENMAIVQASTERRDLL